MIRPSQAEAEDILKWFFKKTKRRSAVRLSSIGGVIYSQVPDHPLRCYIQAILCYCLGCFDASIAAASMATEFHLNERIRRTQQFQKEVAKTQMAPRNPKRRGEVKEELLQKMQEGRATYGEQVRLARILKVLDSEWPEHEAINDIRTAYLHKSTEKLRKLHRKEIEAIAEAAPESEKEMVKNHLARLYAELYPDEKALEAVKRAGDILAPRISQSRLTLEKFEQLHRRLFAPLLHD